jgi:hypothetical protein
MWMTLREHEPLCIPVCPPPNPIPPLGIARVNLAAAAHGATDVPALSPLMLGVLAIVLAGAAWLVLGARGSS